MKTYADLYDVLLRRINTLLSSDFFYSRESFRKPLSKVILEFFPMLRWLSKVTGAQEDLGALFEKFRDSYKPNQNESVKPVEFSEISLVDCEDEINYLPVCVKNICNVDIDSFDATQVQQQNIPDISTQQFKNKNVDAEYAYKNFLGDFEEALGNGLRDNLAKAHARFQIERKMRAGEIYVYKTKPIRNLVIKCLLVFLWVLALVSSSAVFFSPDIDNTLSRFFYSFIMCFSGFNLFYLFKSLKNDNFKYSFQKKSFVFSMMFSIIFLFSFLFDHDSIFFSDEAIWRFFELSAVSSSFLSVVVYIFSYLYLQPKYDKEFLDKLMEEHKSDISGISYSN